MALRSASLASLRAFEAVGRLGSLTKAARELFVTPAAVSHRIADLEARVGTRLFTRRGKSYELTGAGLAGFRTLGDAFERLALAVELMDRAEEGEEIGLVAVTTLASRWILPRLGAFEAAHPGVTVALEASDTPLEPREYHPDVIIAHSNRPPDGRAWQPFIADRLIVVAAPTLLAAGPPLRGPAELPLRRLIHIDWRAGERGDALNWRRWFAAQGIALERLPRGLHVNQAQLALDLAEAGRGFALVGYATAERALRAGRLAVALAPPVAATPFWLLVSPTSAARGAVTAFCDWLAGEAKKTLAYSAL